MDSEPYDDEKTHDVPEDWPLSTAVEIENSHPCYDLDAHVSAPYFCPRGVLNYFRIRRDYCDGSDFLPRNVLYKAIFTKNWLKYLTLSPHSLKSFPTEPVIPVRRPFIRALLERFVLLPGGIPVYHDMDSDTSVFKTN